MSQSRTMYRLQKLDTDIEQHRTRVRELNAALEQDQALRQVQSRVAELEAALRQLETRAVDLNLEIKTVGDQTSQFSERLYGGSVGNPKELEDLQNKIAERKRRRAHLEDDLLDIMIQVEELQASLADSQKQRDEIEAAWSQQQQTLTRELHRVKLELKTLKAERQAAAENVIAANLELYETLRAQKRGQAVAILEDDSCSVCRVGQTDNIIIRVRRGEQLVMCTSCGRILVAMG